MAIQPSGINPLGPAATSNLMAHLAGPALTNQQLTTMVQQLETRLAALEQVLVVTGSQASLQVGLNSVVVKTSGVEIRSGTNLDIKAGGNMDLQSSSAMTLASSAKLEIKAAGQLVLKGATITQN